MGAIRFLITFLAPAIWHWSEGCGLSTHMEIGHRAMGMFRSSPSLQQADYKALIIKHQDAFQAGNTYPDSYYSNVCFQGVYHDVSEDTHWTPFLNVTLIYLRENFPPPWSNETEKLIVFMLGFISHQVADISWHSLGIDYGFLSTMAAMDFHGVFSDAHSVGDYGGDVVNHFRGDYSYFNADEWYVPVEHLVNIYRLYYGALRIDADVVQACTELMYLTVIGEQLALSKLFNATAEKSPFLVDMLDTYFLGGQYDMAMWTTRIWTDALSMLENGFVNCSTPENPLYIRCGAVDKSELRNTRYKLARPQHKIFGLTGADVIVRRTAFGVHLQPTRHIRQKLEEARRKHQKTSFAHHPAADISSPVHEPVSIYSTSTPYSSFGDVLVSADLNGDGWPDLLIGAPTWGTEGDPLKGAVYIVYGNSEGLPTGSHDISDIAFTLYGPELKSARFGTSIAALDMNLDGFIDLAIGAPYLNSTDLLYIGAVHIFTGSADGFRLQADAIYNCGFYRCLLGAYLTTGDMNGDGTIDLAMSSYMSPPEQSGFVCFTYSSKSMLLSGSITLDDSRCLSGSGNYSWYAKSIEIINATNPGINSTTNGTVALISAPLYRQCSMDNCTYDSKDNQTVGIVYVYSLPDLFLLGNITGPIQRQQLGSSLSYGCPYGRNATCVVAVGAAAEDLFEGDALVTSQTGCVHLYNKTSLDSPPLTSFCGDRQYSRFGADVKFFDLDFDGNDELLISAPLRTDDVEELQGAEQGKLFIYKVTPPSNPRDERGGDKSSSVHFPNEAAVILQWPENKAHFGSTLAVLPNKNPLMIQLAVSAVRSSLAARLSGSVLVFNNPFYDQRTD